MGTALLEVTVLGPRDVAGADEGGADRLHLVGEQGLSPEPNLVSATCRETEVPVFAVLRLNDSWTTTGGELTRLVGLAEDYLACGAAGVTFGFLDADLEVDTRVCEHLAGSLPGVPWIFPRAIDAALDPRRSWRRLLGLPGLVAVRSAGSPQGLSVGYDELLETAAAEPRVAALAVASGGLLGEHVPWFVRAGVRQFHLEVQARPGATYRSYVDAGHVRSWRLLLDDAVERAAGSAVG
jgi:copper homeostasis protein